MFCQNCGAEIYDAMAFCPHCGFQQTTPQAGYPAPPYGTVDTGDIGWGVLGFFVPLVGLILFLVWNDTKPRTAKMAGKGALISVLVSIAFYILVMVLAVGLSFA